MKPKIYYNEIDGRAAAWLRALIADGVIPEGVVDETDIREIEPESLAGFTQCHFFAGIGGWAYALRLVGWPAEWPVWSGSCPCQPFSGIGDRQGFEDPRHLWPAFRYLIQKRAPAIVFGEQVGTPVGRLWLSGVRSDMETLGYECGGADLCAAGIGAPQIRQRLFWMAHARGERLEGYARDGHNGNQSGWFDPQTLRSTGEGCNAHWSTAEWHECADGKRRPIPVEPAFFPLVDGLPAEYMGLLRGTGNAIVPQLAAEFIAAGIEAIADSERAE